MVEKVRRKGRMAEKMFLFLVVVLAAAFLPVSTVLAVGMLPTFVAFFTDPTREKTRAFTIGLLNFIPCFHFCMQVALDTPTMDGALAVLTDPINIVIMFAGGAAGYFFDWTFAGISNVIMTGRARQRLEGIDKRQEELVRRWGKEVTGTIPLDPDGFPLQEEEENKK